MRPFDVVSVGRVSVDLYANETGIGFDRQQTFTKSVGGSPTNVAIAAARLGRRAAVVTKVGDDALGRYVTNCLAQWGVCTDLIGTDPEGQTPLALAALDEPETPSIAFYRGSAAPDTRLTPRDLADDIVNDCGVLWVSLGALAAGTTSDAVSHWINVRARRPHTVLDLDYRPSFWPDQATARAAAEHAINLSTVVVGNQDECRMAVGTANPEDAAQALLSRGVRLAVVKLGSNGALLATDGETCRVEGLDVDVRCGLGAGDAFGGALCHGLLSGWDLRRIGSVANAAGAIVVSRLTCGDAMPTIDELTVSLGPTNV